MILRKILKNANFQYFSDLLLFLLPYRVCERMNELRRLQNNGLNLQISPIDVDDICIGNLPKGEFIEKKIRLEFPSFDPSTSFNSSCLK